MITLEEVLKRAEIDAKTYGYYLIPDKDLLQAFLEGLKANEERYGYPSCPCRLASGSLDYDRDIICPCDYRDPDVAEYGACYCRLYVNKEIYEGKKELPTIPERRSIEKQLRSFPSAQVKSTVKEVAPEEKEKLIQMSIGKKKLWYCKQCGYVAFREDPPYVCPICKAKKDMFAEIKPGINFSG